MHVTDADDLRFGRQGHFATVEEDEMVAQALHLDEGAGEGLLRGWWKPEEVADRHQRRRRLHPLLVNTQLPRPRHAPGRG